MSNTTMRLDRFLELSGACKSRTDAKKVLHNHCVYVNDTLCLKAESKVDIEQDVVLVNGTRYTYKEFRYFVLNKPEGVISATKDRISDTVLALIPEADPERYFPVGRLDKDTEGLLIVTNDGAFAHKLLSPKKEVGKTYLAEITGVVNEEEKQILQNGIQFEDFKSLPAVYEFVRNTPDGSEALLTIYEGKFHQVKRMFHAVGHEVLKLKRVAIGGFTLPGNMKPGEYAEYTLEQLHEAIYQMD